MELENITDLTVDREIIPWAQTFYNLTSTDDKTPPEDPAEVLRRTILAHGLTFATFSRHIGVNPSAITHILSKQNDIGIDMAIRLGHAFDTPPMVWLYLQMRYDLYHREIEVRQKFGKIKKLPRPSR